MAWTDMNMMKAIFFFSITCISAEHETFRLYMNVQCHLFLPASALKAFLILLWSLLHDWLMRSTEDM